MKNFFKLLGIIALVAVVVTMTGCVTASSVGGTADPHGLFGGGGGKRAVTASAEEIASYSVILGLFDSGYESYVSAVKKAEAEGKLITTTKTWYLGIFNKITAFAQTK
ncbi:MAG: hypothetical protein LBH20_09605 [Treponema sp.]|jgi:hypothetical protein|nr:hypothetical protein [Treponema sp.]